MIDAILADSDIIIKGLRNRNPEIRDRWNALGDTQIERQAGDLMRRFRPSHGLELGDALIAATASLHGLRLWTRNRKHYPMRDLKFY